MKFAIRDDDTNFFTNPEHLEACYSDVWDICPVSLSVVPFHARTESRGIPEEYRDGKSGETIYPVGKNRELVVFLKEKIREARLSIMMHGYSHKNNKDGYEFETGRDLEKKVRTGKRYLEDIFGCRVDTFVPPHNTVSRAGYEAVIKSGMNLIGGGLPLGKRPFRVDYISPYIRTKAFRFFNKGREYPYAVRFRDHKESGYCSLTPRTRPERLEEELYFAHGRDGIFILSTHFWELDRELNDNKGVTLKSVLKELLDRAGALGGVDFVKVDDIFKK